MGTTQGNLGKSLDDQSLYLKYHLQLKTKEAIEVVV